MTGDDGVLLSNWEKPRDPDTALGYLVIDGADIASIGLNVPGQVAQGLSPRAYIYTDRPAYRPGQTVEVRGIVRETRDGQYENPEGQSYKLEVFDSRGRLLISRPALLSKFGTFHESIGLDSSAPVGSYRIHHYQPGKSEFAGAFEVQSYRLEKVDVAIELPKTVYFRGETIAADVVAKYQYGAPVANKLVDVHFANAIHKAGRTDGAGKLRVEFSTSEFAEEQRIPIRATLVDENVTTVAEVALAIRALQIRLSTTRDTYLDGESFSVEIAASDPLGKPVAQSITLAVVKRIVRNGEISERQVSEQAVVTDAAKGEISARLKVDDADGGPYVLRAFGKDRFGNVILSDRVLTISGKADQTRLRLLADRLSYRVGETARVNLHSRVPSGPALLAWEADRVIQYRIVDLKAGDNPLTWPVEGPQSPNFTLTAARMSTGRFDEARLDLRVERDLRVTLTPKRPSVAPGDDVEVEVSTTDQLGHPVAAELSLALVDHSLLRIFGDRLPPVGPYFYTQSRTGTFATQATNLFEYVPATQGVSEALVEEAERLRAIADNDKLAPEARRQAQAAFNTMFQAGGGQGRAAGGVNGSMDLAMPDPAEQPAKTAPAPQAPQGAAAPTATAGLAGARDSAGRSNVPREFTRIAVEDNLADLKEEEKAGALGLRSTLGRKSRGLDAEGKAEEPRQRFVETAYWNPSIVTGANGKTTVQLKAPGAMSEYRFMARGVTGADTLVGQATAELIVRKDFFVDLKAPSSLTQGDKPRFMGQLHHVGVAGAATLSLTVYSGGRQDTYPKMLALKGDGVEEVVFDPVTVADGDSLRLTLKAVVGDRSDELTEELPIRPWGVQAFASASGTSSDDATVFVGLPPGRAYENADMLVMLAPSLRRMIVELALNELSVGPIARHDRRLIDVCPILPLTVADRASELIAGSAALQYLRAVKAERRPKRSGSRRASRDLSRSSLRSRTTTAAGPGSPQNRRAGGRRPAIA